MSATTDRKNARALAEGREAPNPSLPEGEGAGDRAVEELLRRSVAAAEAQLAAARRLETEKLREATAERQDLLFELQVSDIGELDLGSSPRSADHLRALRALDQRLERVLSAGLAVVRDVLPVEGSPVYNAGGRLRGS